MQNQRPHRPTGNAAPSRGANVPASRQNPAAPQNNPALRRRPIERRAAAEPQEAPPEIPQAVDLHIRVGLEDELIRLTPKDWFTLVNLWMLGGEDVVVRVRRKNHELNLVLRGSQNGAITVRSFDPTKPLPEGQVISTEQIREQMLKESGITK